MDDIRERRGRRVREVWVMWAREQPNPKPAWLIPWEELDGGQREVDMRIGAALWGDGFSDGYKVGIAACVALTNAEKHVAARQSHGSGVKTLSRADSVSLEDSPAGPLGLIGLRQFIEALNSAEKTLLARTATGEDDDAQG